MENSVGSKRLIGIILIRYEMSDVSHYVGASQYPRTYK